MPATHRVSEIYFDENNLVGSLSASLKDLSHLQSLGLFNTQLSGSIPSELGMLSNLKGLVLHGNRLSGSIPPKLGQLTNLVYLNLTLISCLVLSLPVLSISRECIVYLGMPSTLKMKLCKPM